ncbi:MAG: AMP-binding protein [Caulobacteraceae bacterium]
MPDAPAPPPPLYDPTLSFGARLSQIAREKPDAPALTDATHTLTWREFDRRTNRIARGLAKAGVKFGDVVSIALPNTTAYLEVAFAALEGRGDAADAVLPPADARGRTPCWNWPARRSSSPTARSRARALASAPRRCTNSARTTARSRT